jgi:hypothetical protein
MSHRNLLLTGFVLLSIAVGARWSALARSD